MERSFYAQVAFVTLALVVVCMGIATAQPYTPAEYYPFAVGNHHKYFTRYDILQPQEDRWTFIDVVSDTVFGIPGETTSFLVEFSENIPGQPDTTVNRRSYFTFNANGDLCRVAELEPDTFIIFNPPVVWLRNPISVGDTFSLTIGGYRERREVIMVTDTLNLPMGNFSNCLRIRDITRVGGVLTQDEFLRVIPSTLVGSDLVSGNGKMGFTYYETDPPYVRAGYSYLVETSFSNVENLPTGFPSRFRLYPSYPNPFNSSTTLQFDLPKAVRGRLVVYDVLGRNITTLSNGMLSAGVHAIRFDADHLSSGLYFVRFESAEFNDIQKVMLVK